MTTYAQKFIAELAPQLVYQSANTALFVTDVPVVSGAISTEPSVKTLTIETATPAIGDTTISLTSDVPVYIRSGAVLKFSSGDPIVAAETKEITSIATSIAIEEITANPPANNDTHGTWGLLRILTPSAVPINVESQTVENRNYSQGLQSSDIKTRVTLTSDVTLVAHRSDVGFWKVVHPAGMNNQDIFALIVTESESVFGAVQISSLSLGNEIDDIHRPSFTMNFQSPFARLVPFAHLSTEDQACYNEVRVLAGLKELVA